MAISQFLNLDTDTTLSTNSDTVVASEKAIKTYVDNKAVTADGTTIENNNNVFTTVAVKDQNNTSNAIKEWIGTKQQYDAILSKDANTKYIITDDVADNCIVIDTELSSTSTNPVQNRAIYAVIGDIETLINAL